MITILAVPNLFVSLAGFILLIWIALSVVDWLGMSQSFNQGLMGLLGQLFARYYYSVFEWLWACFWALTLPYECTTQIIARCYGCVQMHSAL